MTGASKANGEERRQFAREQTAGAPIIKLRITPPGGSDQTLKVELLDGSAGGFCMISVQKFAIGARVEFAEDVTRLNEPNLGGNGKVAWTRPDPHGGYRIGVCYDNVRTESSAVPETVTDDYYDLLQVSPKAHPDTIHRVYRLLAQRYHPDNRDSGDIVIFRRLVAAFEALSDPDKRAAYDLTRHEAQQRRWRIFDHKTAAQGAASERRKRQGMLALLYTKRMTAPEGANVSVQEMEELLGVPRDHLEFGLWYLKENSYVIRSDGGKFAITAKGVDEAERVGAVPGESGLLLLAASAT